MLALENADLNKRSILLILTTGKVEESLFLKSGCKSNRVLQHNRSGIVMKLAPERLCVGDRESVSGGIVNVVAARA
jgi:hypothetical protein